MKQTTSIRLRVLCLLLLAATGLTATARRTAAAPLTAVVPPLSVASPPQPLKLTGQHDRVSLEQQLWIWLQPGLDGQLSHAQEAWKSGHFRRLDSENVKAGFRPTETLWVRLALQPEPGAPQDWVLTIPSDLPDELAVFIRRGHGPVEERVSGRGLPFASREVVWRGLAFHFILPPLVETELFLRARTRGALHFAVSLQRPWAFQQWHTKEDLGYGVLFGVLAIVGMLGLTRALRFRSITDLLYAGYVLAALLVLGVMAGYTKLLGLIDSALGQRMLSNFGFLFTSVCLCWFSVLLIEWPERDQRRTRLLAVGLTLLGMGIPLGTLILVPLHFPLAANQASIGIVGVLVLMVGDATLRNLPGARRLALAFSPMVFIAGIGLLSTRGVINSPIVFTYYAMNAAALFHCLMVLSVILNRDAHLRMVRDEQLAHERAMLEVRVQERTQALERRESELHGLLQNAPLPMTVVSRGDARVVYANAHAATLYGQNARDIVGSRVEDLFCSPEDLPVLTARFQAQGFLSEYEVQLKNAQGGVLWVAISMVPIQFHEQSARLVSLVDITERKAREDALHQLASIDALTGAWNRRHLEACIAQCRSSSPEAGSIYTVLLFDVDHFKRINDTFGHSVGDEVLRRLVQVARSALRSTDLLARWGGEEFVLFCPGLTLLPGHALAERLRERVQSASFTPAEQITISIGCAESAPDECWEDCFIRADQALYRAKSKGRNQVQLAPTPELRSGPDISPAADPPG